jgi:Ran GTPase-activating protein (RanGAP) involved in mRNA processing and transport
MDDFQAIIKMIGTLTTLNLDNKKIGNEGAKALAKDLEKNTTLTILNLDESVIKDEGAKALAKLLTVSTALKNLDLRDNQIGVIGVEALEKASMENPTKHINLEGQAPSVGPNPTNFQRALAPHNRQL